MIATVLVVVVCVVTVLLLSIIICIVGDDHRGGCYLGRGTILVIAAGLSTARLLAAALPAYYHSCF